MQAPPPSIQQIRLYQDWLAQQPGLNFATDEALRLWSITIRTPSGKASGPTSTTTRQGIPKGGENLHPHSHLDGM
jgi:hypothetical protein